MKKKQTPILDDRQEQQLFAELVLRIQSFVPGWIPGEGGPGSAMLHIYARYLEVLVERLNQAPDKNKLAFLDLLGINLIPAQGARAPLVFQPLPALGDGRVPAGSKAGAPVKGLPDPLVFETESDIAITQARLAEVVTLWPGRDAYADHSRAVLGRKAFRLFEPLQPVPHILYLMHDVHFALAGSSSVEIEFEMGTPAPQPLQIAWEYWDGQVWRGFKDFKVDDIAGDSFDGTFGLTRSGIVRLAADCAETARIKVNGVNGHWIRAHLTQPLPPQPGLEPPQVDRIQISTVIERLIGSGGCSPGLLPEQAFADAQKLDLTKTFQPLGPNPLAGSAFYISSAETFGKPGAQATICFTRNKTAQEEADVKGHQYEIDVNAAKQIVQNAKDAGQKIVDLLKKILDSHWLDDPSTLFASDPKIWYSTAKSTVMDALDLVMDGINFSILQVLFNLVGILNPLAAIFGAFGELVSEAKVAIDLLKAAAILSPDLAGSGQTVIDKLNILIAELGGGFINLANGKIGNAMGEVKTATDNFLQNASNPQTFLTGDLPSFFGQSDPVKWFDDLKDRITKARTAVTDALTQANTVMSELNKLNNIAAAAVAGILPPLLTPPSLIWEFWNGTRWQPLVGPALSNPNGNPSNNDPINLLASGSVSFPVPPSWEANQVNSIGGLWLRVRQAGGSYARMRLVSWTDQQNNVNFVPIIEPRPPVLDNLFIGYVYHSPKEAPQYCLALNDFRWSDHTRNSNWRGDAFAPFQPVEDTTPALYLGFDRPLPADRIGLYLDIQETPGGAGNPPLRWEYWDGSNWLLVSVEDETLELKLPGTISVLWPGVPAQPSATIIQTEGSQVTLVDNRQAARFQPGDQLYLRKGDDGELGTVTTVAENVLTLKTPLAKNYAGGSLNFAELPRFGIPRTWLRARLQSDGEPPRPEVASIDANAVWARQVQTVNDELLGSSNGQMRQAYFVRRSPVLAGQTIEVRELEGARAEVELPILKRELLRLGLSETDLRPVKDKVTGKVREVWVRWQERPHLLFSGPEDRHYVIERSQGQVRFGDGRHGKIPTSGVNNLLARSYRAGGGVAGNVASGAVNQLLSGVLAQGVTNPRAAGGGAEAETLAAVQNRGPQSVRHRKQAIALSDYEWLAREASPSVAVARAQATTHPDGRPMPGWVRLVILPQSSEPRPQPSFELRQQVLAYITRRTPAAMAGQLTIAGPDYLAVGVEAVIAPRNSGQGGPALAAARQALMTFLHPLTGGPEGDGWPFGRDVYLSDVAAVLEAVPGVDYVSTLLLLLNGTPQGEQVNAPPDRIVAAGDLRLSLVGREA